MVAQITQRTFVHARFVPLCGGMEEMMDIQNELAKIGAYKMFPGSSPDGHVARYNTPIASRENIRRAFRQEELWTPVTSEILTMSPLLVPDNIARGFVIEKNRIDNDVQAGGPDMFGVQWEWVPQVGGSMVRAEADQLLKDIKNWEDIVKFPNVNDWAWESSSAENAPYIDRGRTTMVWFQTGLFERLIAFLGFENAAVSLIDEDSKPYVHSFFDRLCGLYEEIFLRFKKHYDTDIVYFHDDWGGQHAPFFSADLVREMLRPYLKRLADFLHANDMFIAFHSCGKNESLVPVMIESCVDIWSGQEINDKLAILEKHGRRIRLDASPGFEFGVEYSEEKALGMTKDFLAAYKDHLERVFVANYSNVHADAVFETVYKATRRSS